MNSMIVEFKDLDRTVAKLRAQKLDVYCDGWDIVRFDDNPSAAFSQKGVIRNGRYGFLTRYTCSNKGTWDIRGIYTRAHKR
jgi:hypothetical protein